MVDEFQDITAKEFKLIRRLSEANQNLFVVGDPVQHRKIRIFTAVFYMGNNFLGYIFDL